MSQRLPDGRAPRGARLFPHASTPLVNTPFFDGAAPTPVLAGSEAAERRAEAPVGAPLWGHLRPLVGPAASSSAPSVAEAAGATPRVAPERPVPESSPRSVAMELIAPFVEAARAESTSAASSFARPASPVVSGHAPDEASRSLVTALAAAQSAGAQASTDRLTLADLTLISFASATEQVAASPHGAAPQPAASHSAGGGGGRAGGAGAEAPGDEDGEVDLIAERVYDRLRMLLRERQENRGHHLERFK
jgi:hypothetical protein